MLTVHSASLFPLVCCHRQIQALAKIIIIKHTSFSSNTAIVVPPNVSTVNRFAAASLISLKILQAVFKTSSLSVFFSVQ